MQQSSQTTVVLGGHIDHGKSTLLGRLLVETGAISQDRLDRVDRNCKSKGQRFQYSYLLDALEAEQKNNITIDTSQVRLSIGERPFTFVDAPGHREYLKNMVTGASQAHAALFLIDAIEGIQDQTRRHAAVLRLLGIQDVIVIFNKMDLAQWSEERFLELQKQSQDLFNDFDCQPNWWIPVSAYYGDNISKQSTEMRWYQGPHLFEVLTSIAEPAPNPSLPFRLPVQDVYGETVVGQITSGEVKIGDKIQLWPNQATGTIARFENWPITSKHTSAQAGQSIALKLEGIPTIERGQIITHTSNPPQISTTIDVSLFWMGKTPLTLDNRSQKYKFKLATQSALATPTFIHQVFDGNDIKNGYIEDNRQVKQFDFSRLRLQLDQPLAFDHFSKIPELGRFVLMNGSEVVGGGIIEDSLSTGKTKP